MTLVFLYGPPAAGKLTVARELSSRTGFRVFHNHLTIDLAHEIFPERNEAYGDLVLRLRLDAVEAAAKASVSIILTFVYAAGQDDEFVTSIVEAVERHGGEVAFVQLLPNQEALWTRIDAPSRQATSKLRSWEILEGLLDGYDLSTPIPGSLTIDNSDRSPQEVAAQIAGWLGL